MRASARRSLVPAVAALAGLALPAPGVVSSSTIALAPHGDSIAGSVGRPVPLTSSSFLSGVEGSDGSASTADDETLFVTGVGGTPVVTALATPFLSDYTGSTLRLSATRAVVLGRGPDGAWNTADDVVNLLDGLGGANTVTPITIGRLNESDFYAPVALDGSTIAVCTRGPDGTARNADDAVALVSDLGGTNTVTFLAAPFLTNEGRGKPIPLSPTSFLVVSDGPDGTRTTADDLTYLFTGIGGTPARADLATPYLNRYGMSTPVRLGPTRAVVASVGPDLAEMTSDDLLHVLDDLGGTNAVSSITVPNIGRYGSGVPVPLGQDSVLVVTQGADSASHTADDSLALVTGLGGTPAVSFIVVGGLSDYPSCRPVPLGPGTFAFSTGGPDSNNYSADDQVVVLTDIGGTNTLTRFDVSALDEGNTAVVVPLSPTAFLVGNGGPDGTLDNNGGDDRFTAVSDIFGAAPVFEHTTAAGEIGTFYAAAQQQALGAGRSVAVLTGPDFTFYQGNDDVFQVLEGLPSIRDLVVAKASLRFDAEDPEKAEKVSASGTLVLDGADPLAGHVLWVSVGNACQALDTTLFAYTKGTYRYADPQGLAGWVRKFSWKPATGKFSVSGKGLGTGAATTSAGSLAVSVAAGDVILGETVAGTSGNKGIAYKRPRE